MKFGTNPAQLGKGEFPMSENSAAKAYIYVYADISENAENARNGYSKKGRKTPFF